LRPYGEAVRGTATNMTDNVAYPEIRWQVRFTIETRRQRRTGTTIFRVWWHRENGRQYVEFDDPVALAKRLVYFLAAWRHWRVDRRALTLGRPPT
jgi:hypothetical protein